MSHSQQTCTAAVLGTDEDYHRTQLQDFVWSRRQLPVSGDHFEGDCGNNASLLLWVDFVAMEYEISAK